MNLAAVRAFRERLKQEPLFGPFSKTCDPAMIEVLGHAGFDPAFNIFRGHHVNNPNRVCAIFWGLFLWNQAYITLKIIVEIVDLNHL